MEWRPTWKSVPVPPCKRCLMSGLDIIISLNPPEPVTRPSTLFFPILVNIHFAGILADPYMLLHRSESLGFPAVQIGVQIAPHSLCSV